MKRRLVVAAGAVFVSACSWINPGPKEFTAVLVSAPPEAGHTLGGSVDAIDTDPATGLLTVRGWHMLTPETPKQELKVFAPEAEAVISQRVVARPDVVEAVGNQDLANAGFEVVIKLKPGAELSRLCLSIKDRHYGKRVLNPHSPDQVQCTPA